MSVQATRRRLMIDRVSLAARLSGSEVRRPVHSSRLGRNRPNAGYLPMVLNQLSGRGEHCALVNRFLPRGGLCRSPIADDRSTISILGNVLRRVRACMVQLSSITSQQRRLRLRQEGCSSVWCTIWLFPSRLPSALLGLRSSSVPASSGGIFL